MAKDTVQLRIERLALDAWRAALGVDLDDGAAANSAIKTAADIRRREAESMALGMHWFQDLVKRRARHARRVDYRRGGGGPAASR